MAEQFRLGVGAISATNTNQRFIYNHLNGDLFFDADGMGATTSSGDRIACW
ncbi:hypothetical protein IQ230_08865 [Gloeocapsopsis crepidinum LEGE 06123]|uniref:Uncharacterized protein n=1 Tax=Gloeocapsopsis crepidinum LEGE 06123 TaxID=588587 RepID=A0ABR9UQB2_9CHRO|nr:hypothetical protein [Gloeocapsopsis crepidinum]MBE9190467.1 hypothetical protein [Gloeocapsopsis crepidinum LEGE 06123]